MRRQLEKALGDAFPFMQRGLSEKEQVEKWGHTRNIYDAYGMELGDGWYQVIWDMCAEITAVYETEGLPVDLVVDQVKEKFGTLRFYYHPKDQEAAIHAFDCLNEGSSLRFQPSSSNVHQKTAEIVGKYETLSAQVCEICGKPGCLRKNLRRIQTLCEEHYHKNLNLIKKTKQRRQ